MNQAEWLAEVGKVADELGYGITEIRPSTIELMPKRSGQDVTIRITSVFLSGDELRRLLRPVEGAKP